MNEELKRMAEAVVRYGQHKPDCTKKEHGMFPCSCGYDKAETDAISLLYGVRK
jgi:hypothetical protein